MDSDKVKVLHAGNSGPSENCAERGWAGHKVGSLSDLVHELAKWRESPVAGMNFIVVSVSSAMPETKRTPQLVEQIKDSVLAQAVLRGGKAFELSDCDFGVLVRL
jgi:hypothetical protein